MHDHISRSGEFFTRILCTAFVLTWSKEGLFKISKPITHFAPRMQLESNQDAANPQLGGKRRQVLSKPWA